MHATTWTVMTTIQSFTMRWFEYGAFQPNFRSHGSRKHNEVWSYGKAAEPILEKYLRLRYQLMPYIYSLGYSANQTGAPFMRGLFLDFGSDPQVANIGDEYMFGPALLVAPVTEQGATSRSVYLPAGTDWYNFWTNERLHGGQRITVAAPIDTISALCARRVHPSDGFQRWTAPSTSRRLSSYGFIPEPRAALRCSTTTDRPMATRQAISLRRSFGGTMCAES